eukprot:EG_transcript_10875
MKLRWQLPFMFRAAAHRPAHAPLAAGRAGRPLASASHGFLQKPCAGAAPLGPLQADDGLSTARVVQPDDANPAGNVHGGTILKLIEQAGFVVASRLCNRARRTAEEPPMMGTLAQMFQMDFFLPMYVGDLAKLYAQPQFNPGGGVGVTVDVWAENVITGEVRHTNHAILCYAIVHAETGAQLVPCTDRHSNHPSPTCCLAPAAPTPPPLSPLTFPLPPPPPLPPGPCRTSEESAVHLVQLMLPGDCQRGNVVGGGVIMKLMDAAAGVCAFKHCCSNVVTVSIETLTFNGQVLLGDIVHVHARIVFTSTQSMDCLVNVEVERLRTGQNLSTTSGTFTLVSLDNKHRPQPVPAILPRTEEEVHLFHAHAKKYEARKKRTVRKAVK